VYVPKQQASEQAANYQQQQISGVPFSNEYRIDDKNLDGVGTNPNGSLKLIEAKGANLADKLQADGQPKNWFKTAFKDNVTQIQDQAEIAKNYGGTVEVHVAEKPYADALRTALQQQGVRNAVVIFTPPQ
jgi:hypothetical protein